MLHTLLCYTLHESSFSRSYGGILPSSLTRVFPRTLGFSPRLPVSVYGTGSVSLPRSFSRQLRINHFTVLLQLAFTSQLLELRICL